MVISFTRHKMLWFILDNRPEMEMSIGHAKPSGMPDSFAWPAPEGAGPKD